jgi:hypothetical protein
MAVRGDDALEIQERAGHTDFDTTQGYVRLAEAIGAGFGEPFPTLPATLLKTALSGAEQAQKPGESSERIVQNDSKYMKSLRGGRDSNPRPPA